MIVSAAMSADGIPFAAFAKARVTQQIAMSQPVFDELVEVLHRPGLVRFMNPVLRADLMDELLSATTWFTPLVSVADCRDPRDDKFSHHPASPSTDFQFGGSRPSADASSARERWAPVCARFRRVEACAG